MKTEEKVKKWKKNICFIFFVGGGGGKIVNPTYEKKIDEKSLDGNHDFFF